MSRPLSSAGDCLRSRHQTRTTPPHEGTGPRAFVVFCSPAGTTRHVAGRIVQRLEGHGVGARQLDLSIVRDTRRFVADLRAAGSQALLFVGSPVYRDRAVWPVMAFIDALPQLTGVAAIPFVTWGGACSGIALWQMGAGLAAKGGRLAGAAKVLAVHALMWTRGRPAGQGHPDDKDLQQVADLVDRVVASRAAAKMALPLEALDYQPAERGAELKKALNAPWETIPKRVDEKACTQCAICRDVCPVGAIALSPGPLFGDGCFDCFNCIRECPEAAIAPAVSLEQIAARIRERVTRFDEQPPTQIFLPDR